MNLAEWNKYRDDLIRLRDMIYKGTKTINGLSVILEMEDCDILWNLLRDEVCKVISKQLDYKDDVIRG